MHTVAHDQFAILNLEHLKKDTAVVYDVKGVLNSNKVDKRL